MSDSKSTHYYKSHPMPVSSFIKIDAPNEGDELSLVLQVGAYYYSKTQDETYEVVRLLEDRMDSVHFQVISVLDTIPKLEDVTLLKPVILHLPLPLEYFFGAHLNYIGTSPLVSEDLEGYKLYLDQLDFFDTRAEDMVSDLIRQSKKKPLSPVRMQYHNGEVKLS